MSASPLVTFYVPVYNGAAYLRDALDSILAQTFGDWECILIDDHSTDGSAAILEDCRDPRFRRYRQPANMNVANASNLAIRLARGKYLARLDQDDVAVPTRLEQQVSFLETHPGITVCGGAMETFGHINALAKLPEHDGEIKANLMVAVNNIANPASVVRTDFLKSRGILNDPRFPLSCDYGMWVDCALAGANFVNLQSVVTRYRTHPGQSSNDMESLVKGVIDCKLRLLQAWFPDLSSTEIRAAEPLLRVNGMVFLTREAAQIGIAVCDKMALDTRASVHGENRAKVRALLQERRAHWHAHLGE